jgi:transposase
MPRPRYPLDLTDAEWAILASFISPAKPGGRPPCHERRELVNAIGGDTRRAHRSGSEGKRSRRPQDAGRLMAPSE